MKRLLIPFLLLANLAGVAQVKISDMPAASSLTGTEIMPVVQTGVNKKATVDLLRGYTSTDKTNWNNTFDWVTSNGANAVTAFSWGNHAGLYRPIGYVPSWSEIMSKPTTIAGYGITDFNSLGDARWLLKSNNLSDVSNLTSTQTNLNLLYSRTVTGTDAIVQGDGLGTIYFNSATPFNFTIDALVTGTFVMFRNIGTATVTFVDGSGVTSSGSTSIVAGEKGGIEYQTSTTPIIDIAGSGEQPLDSDLTTIAGLTATTDNFLQAKSSAWASRTPAQVKSDLGILYLPLITGYTGAAGSDASIDVATAIDRIPTTAMSVGQRVSAIVTIATTQRRLYTAELVVPVDATANIELSPSVIRPNDFNVSTNNKVWREIKQSGIIDVSNYGVVPSPTVFVSDQITAIITAASAGETLIFPSGDYKIYGITISKKLNFVGFGARFIFSTVNAPHFVISQDLVTMRGFTFIGQGRSNASYPLQGGIRITGASNVLISDCLFDQMPYYCIQTNSSHISDTSSDFGSINIVNCHFMRSKIGFMASTRGEYVNFTGCSVVDNDTGMYIGAGNINIMGSNILDCLVGLDYVTDVNDAHGVVTGCQINHNVVSIRAASIVNGQFFRNNNIYYGDMEISNSNGFEFTDNTLEGLEMKFDNCTGIIVEGNRIPGIGGTVTLTTNWNGNASTVHAWNNKNFSNEYVSGWNTAVIAVPNTFIVGTNKTGLTAGSVLADFQSTSKQILMPRVTNRATVTTPVNGGFDYDAATNLVEFYENGSWRNPVWLTKTQTLTNKTLTSPVLTDPTITGATTTTGSYESTVTNTKKDFVNANLGILGSSSTSSSSIHVNAYYSNTTTLLVTVKVVAIKTDGSASAHSTVTCRFRKDSSGTFTADDTGTDTTSDIAVLADVVGEINGTNPSIKVTMGAASGNWNVSWSAETLEVKN